MVARGPQRICAAQPAKAGCDVIEDLATMSRAAFSPVAVIVVAQGVGAKSCVVLWLRKMEDGELRVGRRVGRWEKNLRSCG